MTNDALIGQNRVIFCVGGFDPSGGAGVVADVKTATALGAYGVACLTALTVQSTAGVRRVEGISASLIRDTLSVLAEDTPPNAIKIGMLYSAAAVEAVAEFVAKWPDIPVVLDPVLRSSSGTELLQTDGLTVIQARLLPLVRWVTPNVAEAAVLAGVKISAAEDVPAAAARLQHGYPTVNVVVTGGHLGAPDDYLLAKGAETGVWIRGERVETTSTHGTGCAFATALAVHLAAGRSPEAAVRGAKEFVTGALRHAVKIGQGNGPMAHFWR